MSAPGATVMGARFGALVLADACAFFDQVLPAAKGAQL